MEYRSVKETAEAWSITERLVQRLCSEGRVAGARKIGGSWAIPQEAEKPGDLRKRRARDPYAVDRPAEACNPDLPGSNRPHPVAPEQSRTAPEHLNAPQDEQPASPNVLSRLMPLMNSSFEPGTCKETIAQFEDPGLRAVAQPENC